jgi:hypothetical protein
VDEVLAEALAPADPKPARKPSPPKSSQKQARAKRPAGQTGQAVIT